MSGKNFSLAAATFWRCVPGIRNGVSDFIGKERGYLEPPQRNHQRISNRTFFGKIVFSPRRPAAMQKRGSSKGARRCKWQCLIPKVRKLTDYPTGR